MSYDLLVYARRERLPSTDRLRTELLSLTPPIVVDDLDLARSSGHVPVRRGQVLTGFDLLVAPVEEDDIDDYKTDLAKSGERDNGFLDVLMSSDTFISLSGKDEEEIAVARSLANAIARLSNGSVFDPQKGLLLQPTTTLDEAFSRRLSWRKTRDVDHPWETIVDGRVWRIRLGDFPAEKAYTLLVNDDEIGSFDDWPSATWTRPAAK